MWTGLNAGRVECGQDCLFLFGIGQEDEDELSNVNFYCSINLLMMSIIDFFQITVN